jgi:type IV fimbrial biogenesis protein FimT
MHARTSVRQAGFNLLELMTTLMIAGLVLGFGIPSFTQFIDNNRMASAANDLVTTIHVARTEAVKRRQTVTICASSNWSDAAPDCDLGGGGGWIAFVDVDGDVTRDAGDTVIQAHAPLADGITFSIDAAATPYIQYGANGFPSTAAAGTPISNIQLCDDRGDADTGGGVAAGRWIQIGPTGRPQTYRMQADVQGNPVGGC